MDKEIKQQVSIDIEEDITETENESSASGGEKYKEEIEMLKNMSITIEKLKQIYDSESSSESEDEQETKPKPIYVTSDITREADNMIKYMNLSCIHIWAKHIREWLNNKKCLAEKYNVNIKHSKDKKILKLVEKIKKQEERTESMLKELKKLISESVIELNKAFNINND